MIHAPEKVKYSKYTKKGFPLSIFYYKIPICQIQRHTNMKEVKSLVK